MAKPPNAAKPTRPLAAGSVPARAYGRSLGDFGRLYSAEKRLLDCCRRGEIAVIAAERPERGTRANRVRAAFVRFLALGGDDLAPVHAHGVKLQGAWLTGILGLDAAIVGQSIMLWHCRIEKIDAIHARLEFLGLDGSLLLDGLMGDGLRCTGGVYLRSGFHARKPVRLVGARIEGSLDCNGGRFECDGGPSLICDLARIAGSLTLGRGFRAIGEVRLPNATIGGTLDCEGGDFVNCSGQALCCDGAGIAGSVFLRKKDSGADKGFRAIGGVRLIGATIGLDLVCDGGHFSNRGGAALHFEGATIAGAAYLRNGFRAIGEVILSDATIGRGFECGGGVFKNRKGSALSCGRANISGGVNLSRGFHASGDVRLPGAQIGSDLNCSKGRFKRGEEYALMCDQAMIAGSVFLKGIEVTGETRLSGSTIRGRIECDGGRFDNGTGDALSLEGARISGPVHLRFGFHATGQVRLVGAMIGDNLDLQKSHFENADGRSLNCYNARIAGSLILLSAKLAKGEVSLSSLHTRDLTDDNSWGGASDRLLLDGFTYERLAALSFTDAKARTAWLDLQPELDLGKEFKPQPWEQAIAALRAAGYVNEARIVAIEKQERLRRAGKIVYGARSFHRLYGLLVGYGYRPLRLLVSIGIVWFIALLAYWAAVNPQWFGSTTHLLAPPYREPSSACLMARAASRGGDPCPPSAPNYQEFFAPAYSAEVLLPVISLGYKDDWEPVLSSPDGQPLFWGWALLVLYWVEIIFGWVAGLMVVSFLGNLIKKD